MQSRCTRDKKEEILKYWGKVVIIIKRRILNRNNRKIGSQKEINDKLT